MMFLKHLIDYLTKERRIPASMILGLNILKKAIISSPMKMKMNIVNKMNIHAHHKIKMIMKKKKIKIHSGYNLIMTKTISKKMRMKRSIFKFKMKSRDCNPCLFLKKVQ